MKLFENGFILAKNIAIAAEFVKALARTTNLGLLVYLTFQMLKD